VFNKEKREKDKAVKEELKELIKPRPTFDEKKDQRQRRLNREAIIEDRNAAVAKRIRDIHAGTAADANIVRFGGDLLYLEGLSQIQVVIQDQFTFTRSKDATQCCARWTVNGVHDKEFLGMAATNRQVSFGGATIATIAEHDTITQEFHYWDMVTMLQQIQAP
jgi:hypothetical protein